MALTQLEELKQQQKLVRQQEQEKKRKLEVDPGDEQSNVEPQQVGLSSLLKNELCSEAEMKLKKWKINKKM